MYLYMKGEKGLFMISYCDFFGDGLGVSDGFTTNGLQQTNVAIQNSVVIRVVPNYSHVKTKIIYVIRW